MEVNIRGKLILVDEQDYSVITKYSWFFTPLGYACTKIKLPDGKRKTIGMHRLILGNPQTPAIDHVNRNKLDNRRQNLRPCSDSDNCRNKPTVKGKKSIYRGVSLNNGKWQVVVRVSGKLKWLGYHKTEQEAAAIAAPYFADIAP